ASIARSALRRLGISYESAITPQTHSRKLDDSQEKPSSEKGRKKVFISYSHKDIKWLDRLNTHLKDLMRPDQIEFWDDTRIQTGAQWHKEISAALNSASAAVLLISPDFIASNFIAENELPPLLAVAEKGGVNILTLILRSSNYEKIESLSN